MNILIVLLVFVMMEGVAWFTHKYIMHGFLWFLHQSHHVKSGESFFERNDFFFLIFAIPGILLTLSGAMAGGDWKLFAGIGITLYGFCYFWVHDVFIHQRFPVLKHTENVYFRAIRKAHKVHHKQQGKYGAQSFGMLWVSPKYFREALRESSGR